jgi:uncharacterized repeat protein (TIGR01451 family)
MKPASSKRVFACALLVPLLGLIGFVLRHSSSGPAPRSIVQQSSATSSSHDPSAASAAIQQLKQDGSYDSLAAAYQAARMQPEPTRNAPAEPARAAYTMVAPWRGVRGYFGPDNVHLRPSQAEHATWALDVRLASYGYGDAQQPVESADPIPLHNGIEYQRGALTEWYLNDQRGLEQGFTLATRPEARDANAAGAPLTLMVAIASDLTPKLNPSADSVAFVGSDGEPVLHYAGLLAWDAKGERLAAQIELRPHGALALVVDDRHAQYPVVIDPLIYAEIKITAPDAATNDGFGHSVAISGDTVVVGVPGDDTPAGTDAGSAHVFVRSGAAWVHQQKLTPNDPAAQAGFGGSVAIAGETITVGAPAASSLFPIPDGNSNTISFETIRAGAAWVFVRNGSTWTQQQKLLPPEPVLFGGFGAALAMSGETVVVGTPGGNIPAAVDAGCAFVFVRTNGIWALEKKLIAGNGSTGDGFGSAVAISGNVAVVGSPRGDTNAGPDTGAAYIFSRTGTNWASMQRLSATPDPAFEKEFGRAVAIHGTDIVVGAPRSDNFAGAAYVYFLNGTTWQSQGKLVSDSPGPVQFFGDGVAIVGDAIVVGAFNAPTPNGPDTGAIYLFARSGSVWNFQQKLFPSDVAIGDTFGWELAMTADTIIAGAQGKNSPIGSDTGAAYIFENATTADLFVSQSADKTSVKQNDVLTYTLTVRNFGPNRAQNVAVDDMLPSGTVFKSAQANKGHFTAPPIDQNGVVTWHLGDMTSLSQESAQLVITVVMRGKGAITNTATVRSSTFDPNLANNTSSLSTALGSGGGGSGGPKK